MPVVIGSIPAGATLVGWRMEGSTVLGRHLGWLIRAAWFAPPVRC